MESYSALAASYDELTQDVGYEKRAAFVEKLFLHMSQYIFCGVGFTGFAAGTTASHPLPKRT